MTAVCPAGHTSSADDYCDVCGMPIEAPATPPAGPAAPTAQAGASGSGSGGSAPGAQPCPYCGVQNAAEALFCENCGYDFTTSTPPRSADQPAPPDQPDQPDPSAQPAPGEQAAEQTAVRPVPVAGDSRSLAPNLPFRWVAEVWIDPAWYEAQDSPDPLPSPGLPEVIPLRHTSVLVGRASQSRNIHPEVDCGSDSGVSRRQTQLTSDGSRWFAEDLDSANGTFVGPASAPLPGEPIEVGRKVQLGADDRIYVGAWTRLVVREATEDEIATLT